MFNQIKDIIRTIDWQQFHFLRPKALYLYIPLVLISILLSISTREKKKWKDIVAPHLRPFLFSKSSRFALVFPLAIFILGASSGIAGLAGPTWKKKESPTEKIQAVVLIALDLSKSMLAKDIQPDRLTRAKFKISDFLDANPRARSGLVVFAGTTHPVLPFTADYKLIKLQASSLENREMPVEGSNFNFLMQYVDTTMKKVTAPSTVLLMTDVIQTGDLPYIQNWLNGSVHRLEIILFSSPSGAPVPGHVRVLSKQDPDIIRILSQNKKITITPLTLDKSDIQGIAKRISDKLTFDKEKTQNEKDWADMGWLMIFPALFFALFQFRKGWSIQWSWLIFLFTFSSCGMKTKHPDWWYSRDYQGQFLSDNNKYANAAKTFDNDQRKAVAFYKSGNFEAAASLFALDSSASGSYNLGLTLGKLGRWEEAMDAIRKSGRLDSTTENKIRRHIVGDSIKDLTAQALAPDKKDKAKSKTAGRKNDKQKSNENQDEESEQEKNKMTDNKKGDASAPSENVLSKKRTAKEADSPPEDLSLQKKQEKATDILLKRAAADPGEFLHRRFLLQKKRYSKSIKYSGDPW